MRKEVWIVIVVLVVSIPLVNAAWYDGINGFFERFFGENLVRNNPVKNGLEFRSSTSVLRNKFFDDGLPKFSQEELNYFSVPEGSYVDELILNKIYLESTELKIDYGGQVSSVSFSGSGKVYAGNGYVRILARDNFGRDHLIFSTDSLVINGEFSVENICEETCNLDGANIESLVIQIELGEVSLDNIYFQPSDSLTKGSLFTREDYLIRQEDLKINEWKKKISENGLGWIAGKTTVSGLTYDEKRKLFGDGGIPEELPNLHGFEYYKGGVFELPTSDIAIEDFNGDLHLNPSSSNLPVSWDWRKVHGENWNTPVKNQGGCGSCWAFSAIGAAEATVNLYFNRHFDLDLSEQDVLSCSGGGTCAGGDVTYATSYLIENGTVDEDCFPYLDGEGICGDKCLNPSEKLRFTNISLFERANLLNAPNENKLKSKIVKGPFSGGISYWNHVMVLVGYNSSTSPTTWIFKNSWGDDWGEGGYAVIKLDRKYIESVDFLYPKVASEIVQRNIVCEDRDGDNYCNWGNSYGMPEEVNCPSNCDILHGDCDDTDPNVTSIGNYYCASSECSDGIDNDGDLLVDLEDPSCISPDDESEYFDFNFIPCVDTDGGLDPLVKSYVHGVFEIYGTDGIYVDQEERCYDDRYFTEWYCHDGYAKPTGVLCSFACMDGKCVGCRDSDVDSDFPDGINPRFQGTVEHESGMNYTDECAEDGVLREYYCNESGVDYLDLDCEFCLSGRCYDPIPICTASEFESIRLNLDESYVQVCDIDLSAIQDFEPFDSFSGIYYGEGHSILNFDYNIAHGDLGLFGTILGGKVYDLKLVNFTFIGNGAVGGLASFVNNAEIINVEILDSKFRGESSVGGLAGKSSNSILINVSVERSYIFAEQDTVGGLIGYAYDNTLVERSFTNGVVSGSEDVGGLIGFSSNIGVIDSFSHAEINSNEDSGGLIGKLSGSLNNSYSTGFVNCSSEDDCGGLIGDNRGSVVNSYWDVNTSGKTWSDGGEGRTTLEMTSVPRPTNTFIGWNFEQVWDQFNGEYPYFSNFFAENCEVQDDEDGNGLADCADPACPYETYCNENKTMLCNQNQECVDACTGLGQVEMYRCDDYIVCDMDSYPLGDAQCQRDGSNVCCLRTSPPACEDLGGTCTEFNCGTPLNGECYEGGECCQTDSICRDENSACSVSSASCCDGLTAVSDASLVNGQCLFLQCGTICLPCGNGVCDSGENSCNCPGDCGNIASIDRRIVKESPVRVGVGDFGAEPVEGSAPNVGGGVRSREIRLSPEEEDSWICRWFGLFC
jgi:C1A family cysteine protease